MNQKRELKTLHSISRRTKNKSFCFPESHARLNFCKNPSKFNMNTVVVYKIKYNTASNCGWLQIKWLPGFILGGCFHFIFQYNFATINVI